MMNVPERNRAIKKLLVNKYGKGNVSVKGDTGTAYGWVKVEVKIDQEMTRREESDRENAIEKEIIDAGIELYTYADDMGYGDHNCIIVRVISKNVPF